MNYFDIYVECLTKGNYNYMNGYEKLGELYGLPMTEMLRENKKYMAKGSDGNSLSYAFYMIERLCEVGIESRLIFTEYYNPELNGYDMKASVIVRDKEEWFVSDYSSDVKLFTERGITGNNRLMYLTADGEVYFDENHIYNNAKMSVSDYLAKCSKEETEKAIKYNVSKKDSEVPSFVLNLCDIRLSKINFLDLISKHREFCEEITDYKSVTLK